MHKSTAAAYDVMVLADGSWLFIPLNLTAICSYSRWKTSISKARPFLFNTVNETNIIIVQTAKAAKYSDCGGTQP